MAGSIPPLVSSSPPPLCGFDDDEEEDDDEYGMYAAAEDIDYNDCISYKDNDEEKQRGDKKNKEQDSTSQDSATDSGLCPDSEGVSPSPTPHSDEERGRATRRTLTLPNGHVSTLDGTESSGDFGNFDDFKFTTHDGSQLAYSDSTRQNDLPVVTPLEEQIDFGETVEAPLDEENDEFENFYSVTVEANGVTMIDSQLESEDSSDDLSPPQKEADGNVESQPLEVINEVKHIESGLIEEKIETSNLGVNQNEDFKSVSAQPENEDEEFNDFVDFKVDFSANFDSAANDQSDNLSEHSKPFSEENVMEASSSSQFPQNDASDDEFSNFADFSSSECVFVSAQSSNSLDVDSHIPLNLSDDTHLRTESEFQDWASAFPDTGSEGPPACSQPLLAPQDGVWTRLLPMEGTPALAYQWADSLANRRLLTSLSIDSRNILMVPRFAATLAGGPLQPVKASESQLPLPPAPALSSRSTHSTFNTTQECVPDAHFDWAGAGLTNPLDCAKPGVDVRLRKALGPSAEAGSILGSLPDISFMRKTYVDFPIKEV